MRNACSPPGADRSERSCCRPPDTTAPTRIRCSGPRCASFSRSRYSRGMDASLLYALILGLVEGVTEFLPISSTGHLILAGDLLGANDERWNVFNIVIQTGAMLAIVWEYRARFFRIDVALYRNLIVAFVPAAGFGLSVS